METEEAEERAEMAVFFAIFNFAVPLATFVAVFFRRVVFKIFPIIFPNYAFYHSISNINMMN